MISTRLDTDADKILRVQNNANDRHCTKIKFFIKVFFNKY